MSSENAMAVQDSRKYFIRLMIPMTIVSAVYSMQLAPMTLYVTDLGGTASSIGLIGGINFLIGMIARPFSGYLTDRSGRQKVYLIGLLAYLISTIGYVFSPNVYVLIFFRAVSGLGVTCTTTAQGAVIADIYPEKVTRCFYIMAMLQTGAGLFAPTLGIYLGHTIGYSQMFAITGVAYFIATILALSVNYEKKYPHVWMETEKGKLPSFSDLFEKTAIWPAFCIMLHGAAHLSINTFIAPYGATLGISNVGLYFTVNSVASVIVTLVLAKFSGQKYRNKVFYIGGFFFIATMLSFMFAKNLNMLYVGAVLFAVGYSATQPILNSIALAAAPKERKGAAQATFSLFWDFGFGAGSTALGFVAASYGYKAMYGVALALVVLIVVIFAAVLSKVKEDTEVVPEEGVANE